MLVYADLASPAAAVKIRGQKLYEAARKGLEIERQPRPVTVKSFKLRRRAQQPREVMWRITCSKGTYIRSLVHDLVRNCSLLFSPDAATVAEQAG